MRFVDRSLVLLAASVALPLTGWAQENIGGLPYSVRYGLSQAGIPVVSTPGLDLGAVALEDQVREANAMLPLYGRIIQANIDPDHQGLWTTLAGGDRIWRAMVESPSALATELFFEDFMLPAGAVMHVYSPTTGELLGGFTSYNNHVSGQFTTAQIMGPRSIIEYFEPASVTGQGRFTISGVGHAYRYVGTIKADACEVDVECPEGNAWEQERDGVVRISVVEPGGLGWCSGSLVNNTAQDCKPYFLTALHCGVNSTDANFNNYKFYFRYQRTGCGVGVALANKVMTGCARRADSNCGGATNGSDFLLVEANNQVPANYFPYFNGWDASGGTSTSGVCIHHPAGDEKKISTYSSNLLSGTWWNAAGAHWRVTWVATTNGWGVTEGGSSGSPIFNQDHHIVGTLTGGGSCCTVNGCGNGTGPTVQDYFGKMSYHWGSQNPNPANEELHVWLDPTNSGATTLDGSYNPCGIYSVEETATSGRFVLYPNPADDLLTVAVEGSAELDEIRVLDVSGRLLLSRVVGSGGPVSIEVSDLAGGAYVVELLNNGTGQAALPLLIQR